MIAGRVRPTAPGFQRSDVAHSELNARKDQYALDAGDTGLNADDETVGGGIEASGHTAAAPPSSVMNSRRFN